MSTSIFYFSGTGNSLAVARDLAAKTDASLTPIALTRSNEFVNPNSEAVGIVFPVYHGGLPRIVQQFLQKLTSLENKYIFAVCTYGDSPGLSLEYLARQIGLHGGRLAAGFSVHLPYNYITPSFNLKDFLGSFTLRQIDPVAQQILVSEAYTKVQVIADYVNDRRPEMLERDGEIITRLVDAIHLHETLGKTIWLKIAGIKNPPSKRSFRESISLMDRAFHADESCKSCGNCVKVCPVDNIGMVNGKPVWRQQCEQCFACLQWCPQQAIQFGGNTSGRKRYHHPAVKMNDMFLFNG
jgi:ferredoxin/flavodoxin